MKRRLAAVAVGSMASIFAAHDARAMEFGTPEAQHPYRSPQNFELEFRFSPYTPQIDDEAGLKGQPFDATFATKPRLEIAAEFDWQMYRIPHVGTIGPGAGVGLVSISRNSQTVTGRASSDTTSLDIYPFWLVAVLRADAFWHDFGFPLVPYGKFGLGYAIWRASNTGGTSDVDGVKGKGGSWGTNIAVGVSFALDVLDRGASRNMDNSTGINNTYIFAELYWLSLDGIAQSHALEVGTNTWAAGLAFEF